MAADFSTYSNPGLDAPAVGGFAITPGTTTFTTMARAIWVGTGGNVEIVGPDGTTVTYKNAADGTVIDAMAVKVLAGNTTATDLIGMK